MRCRPPDATIEGLPKYYFFAALAFFGGAFFAPAVDFLAAPLATPPLRPASLRAAVVLALLAFGAAFLTDPVAFFAVLPAAVPDFPISQRY
jgi:hypothetical protein